MGPIGHAAYPRGDPSWVMPPVRKKFDLFAAVRPALSHAAIASIHKNVDIVFLRELTEGMLYSETVVAGLPEFRPNDDITVAMRVITRKGSRRVAREAFEIARARARKKVTATQTRLLVPPDSKLFRKLPMRLWRRRYRETRRLPLVSIGLLVLIVVLALPFFLITPRTASSALKHGVPRSGAELVLGIAA